MNDFTGVGRLTKDPQIELTKVKKIKNAKFTLALPRIKKVEGQPDADFIRVSTYGIVAENCEKYIGRGSLVSVNGELRTRTYTNKAGQKIFMTELMAQKVEFLDFLHMNRAKDEDVPSVPHDMEIPAGFDSVDDEDYIPF